MWLQARSVSRATSSRSAVNPWLDKAHAALLDNLEEGDENEETSLFEGKPGAQRVRHLQTLLTPLDSCLSI